MKTKVFGSRDEAVAHGPGGVWYDWADLPERYPRRFPDDVTVFNVVTPNGGSAHFDTKFFRLAGTFRNPQLDSQSEAIVKDGECFVLCEL